MAEIFTDKYIDLHVLWRCFMKKKIVFFLTVLFGAFVILVKSLITHPVYMSSTIFTVPSMTQIKGYGQGVNFVHKKDPQVLLNRLEMLYTGIPLRLREKGGVVQFSAYASTPKKAQEFLEMHVVSYFDQLVVLFNHWEARLKEHTVLLKTLLRKPQNSANGLAAQLYYTEASTSQEYVYAPKMMLPPTLNLKPVAPNVKRYIVEGGVFFIALGLFLAFVLGYFDYLRQRVNEKRNQDK